VIIEMLGLYGDYYLTKLQFWTKAMAGEFQLQGTTTAFLS